MRMPVGVGGTKTSKSHLEITGSYRASYPWYIVSSAFVPLFFTDVSWMPSCMTTGATLGLRLRWTAAASLFRLSFQTPWMLTDSISRTPIYRLVFPVATFLSIPNPSLERVRNFESHAHFPIKLIKPDWGHATLTAASFEKS